MGLTYFEIKKLIDENGWGGVSVPVQRDYLKEHKIGYSELNSRSDIVDATKKLVAFAEKEVCILTGDRDDAKDPEVPALYARKVAEIGKENMKIMMNIEGWSLENTKILVGSGASVRHVASDIRAGVIDNIMFAFYRASKDDEYYKVAGKKQRQDDKMLTVGYVTDYNPFVKKLRSKLHDEWDKAKTAEEVIASIEGLRNKETTSEPSTNSQNCP